MKADDGSSAPGTDAGGAASGASSTDWVLDLLDRVGIGLLRVDNQTGQVRWANDAFARIVGYDSAAGVIGASVMDHYSDPKERAETVARFMANPEFRRTNVVRFEARRVRRNTGEPVDVLMRLHVAVRDNRLLGIDGVIEDIGERKAAEKTFREGEERFRVLFDRSPVGIVVTDGAGVITRVNDALCSFLGVSQDAVLRGNVLDLVESEDSPAARPPASVDDLVTAVESNGLREYRFRRPDGGPAWGYVQWSWVLDSDGRRHTGLFMVQDITRRKQMEEALLRMEKLESLGILAGGIAHDFNNILAAVLGNVTLAGALEDAGPRVREILGRAEQATLRARDLTQQLITFARGGSPVKRVGSLGDLARENVEFCLRGTCLAVDLEVAPDLQPAEFDPGQMGQVFHNLLLNAVQAMPTGGTVRVRVRNVPVPAGDPRPLRPGPHVEVVVSDEGPGIPAEHLGRIFDPYFSTRQGGTGLGLATAHSIIRRHGGHIVVHSVAGAGTTFTFWLPASPSASIPAGGAVRPVSPPGPRARLLVMDDEACVRDVAAAILRGAGYDVDLACDGEEAVRAYREAREDGRPCGAVVLDLTVRGGMGGAEAVQRLLDLDPQVRAIVTSGYSANPIMADHRAHGFVDVVAKPFTSHELVNVVQGVLVS